MRKVLVALVVLGLGGAVAAFLLHGTSSSSLGDLKWSDCSPSWSPDGSEIAFASNRPDPKSPSDAIYVVDANGRSAARRLTPPGVDAELPRWSPDGRSIAYVRNLYDVGPNGQSAYSDVSMIDVMRADGTGSRSIAWSGFTHGPAWSPDGAPQRR